MPCSRYDIKNLHHFYTRTLSLSNFNIYILCRKYFVALTQQITSICFVKVGISLKSVNRGHLVQRITAFPLQVEGGPREIIKNQPSIASSLSGYTLKYLQHACNTYLHYNKSFLYTCAHENTSEESYTILKLIQVIALKSCI